MKCYISCGTNYFDVLFYFLEIKKGKADYIAPLRPLTLAAIKPWGDSEGAGRVRLSQCKYTHFFIFCKIKYCRT